MCNGATTILKGNCEIMSLRVKYMVLEHKKYSLVGRTVGCSYSNQRRANEGEDEKVLYLSAVSPSAAGVVGDVV